MDNQQQQQARKRVGRTQPHRCRLSWTVLSVAVAMAVAVVHGWVPTPSPLGGRSAAATKTTSPNPQQFTSAALNTRLRVATPTEDDTDAEQQRQEQLESLFKGYSSSSSVGGATNEVDDDSNLLDQIDGFLDKPFFDPNAYEDDDDSFLGKIANFVKADYELFEAFFVACFFLLLITVAKDLLRAQMAASGVAAAGKLF